MKTAVLVAAGISALLPLAYGSQAGEISDLILRLGDPSFEVREEAEKELLRTGAKAVPLLEKALHSDDPEVIWRAAHILRRIPFCEILGLEAGEAFASASGLDRVDVLRTYASGDLGEKEGRIIADAILGGFAWRERYEPSVDARQLNALRARMKGGPRILSWVLVRMMEHEHYYIRLGAVLDLMEMGARERAPFVARALKDGEPIVRQRAAETLARFEAREYAVDIEELLQDPLPSVRWSAISAVAKLTGSSDVCVRALSDPEASIRASTASLLDAGDYKEALGALGAALEREGDEGTRRVMASAIRSLEALKGSRRPIGVIEEWTGLYGGAEEPHCLRIDTLREWERLWTDHFATERPEVDFSRSMVLAIFRGRAFNGRGLLLSSLTEDDESIRVRCGDASCRWDVPGGFVSPYGIFVVPRSDKPVGIERNVQPGKSAPPVWEEWARLP